jgi:hypothetical protein
MIVLAVASTIVSIIWSLVVVFANGMSDAPGRFQGLGTIIAVWVATTVLWLSWWVG